MTLYKLSNGHASAVAPCIVYDPNHDDGNMLVAVVLADTSGQMLDALKAEMEKNSGNHLRAIPMDTDNDNLLLTAAARGYAHAKTLFAKKNATGQARAHLHPLAGDPRLHPKENFFYVVCEDTDTTAKFIDRLQLATYHTILPAWGNYLMLRGWDTELITSLPILGDTSFFKAALRVKKDNDAWGEIISQGLRTCAITL